MSFVDSLGSNYQTVPYERFTTNIAGSISILNAATETAQLVGTIHLENPLGGSKTISAAGGGKIVWVTGAVTFANAGTTFTVSIQDVSAASNPGQGDGVDDVSVTYTGGGGGVTANAAQQSTIGSGSKTITNGDPIAIVFSMTARGGTDTVAVQHAPLGSEGTGSGFGGAVIDNTSGSYIAQTSAYPMAYIVFDDGSVGWMNGFVMQKSITNVAINSGTATADEYGNILYLPYTFYAIGMKVMVNVATYSSDFEMLLYSDPLGTPAAQRTVSIDASQVSDDNNLKIVGVNFSTPYLIKRYTPIAITARPTTANSITVYAFDGDGVKSDRINPPNAYAYACRRLDNSSAFSDYNGGTAKTRLMGIHLYGYYVEQGVNNAAWHLGI